MAQLHQNTKQTTQFNATTIMNNHNTLHHFYHHHHHHHHHNHHHQQQQNYKKMYAKQNQDKQSYQLEMTAKVKVFPAKFKMRNHNVAQYNIWWKKRKITHAQQQLILAFFIATTTCLCTIQLVSSQENSTINHHEVNSTQMATGGNHSAADVLLQQHKTSDDLLIAVGGVSLTSGASSSQPLLAKEEAPKLQQQQHANKLDYIIDFLRANKLTIFYNLLTSDRPQVKQLISELNTLKQFTLFVPTNEALELGLSASQLNSLQQNANIDDSTKQFLMAHTTSSLVVPQLGGGAHTQNNGNNNNNNALRTGQTSGRWSSGARVPNNRNNRDNGELFYSLAGHALRVITTTSLQHSTKLELTVNGAHVLSGHSHALQEPNNTNVTYAIVHVIDQPLWPAGESQANHLFVKLANNSAELEREESRGADLWTDRSESRQSASKVVRSQRSHELNLIARNNRDFYRPSAAPTNLIIVASGGGDRDFELVGRRRQDSPQSARQNQTSQPVPDQSFRIERANWTQQEPSLRLTNVPPPPPFEVERYKIVLNATTRQQMREQQQQQQQQQQRTGSDASAPPQVQQNQAEHHRFAYDQPLVTQSTPPELNGARQHVVLTYSPPAPQQATQRQNNNAPNLTAFDNLTSPDQVNSSASNQRHQRLLKFQAEDARDHLVGVQGNLSSTHKALAGGGQQSKAPSFSGCAFYDADCKRLTSGKLVRLPPLAGGIKRTSSQQQQQTTSAPVLSVTSVPHRFDSTFGETTDSSLLLASGAQPSHLTTVAMTPSSQIYSLAGHREQQQQASRFDLSGSRPENVSAELLQQLNPSNVPARTLNVSPLNQPLPPWNDDNNDSKHTQIAKPQQTLPNAHHLSNAWLSSGDISRIRTGGAKSLTSADNSTTQIIRPQQQQQQQQQVLMIPVKMFHDSNIPLDRRAPLALDLQTHTAKLKQTNMSVLSVVNEQQQRAPVVYFGSPAVHAPRPSGPTFQSNVHYFTPTAQPTIYTATAASPLGRLTNFTALEMVPDVSVNGGGGELLVANTKQPLRTPMQLHASRLFASSGAINSAPASVKFLALPQEFAHSIKQARKTARQEQLAAAGGGGNGQQLGGDISITSAKLSTGHSPPNGALAVQASNQDVSATSGGGALHEQAPQSSSSQSADFFQNRTIAEIMDDSGLRIDGQQVTFNKLRECLERAQLSNMLSHEDSSITIFMPTDLAFSRLVEAQALAQRSSSTLSSRLTDFSSTRARLLPLIARSPQSSTLDNSPQQQQQQTTPTLMLSSETPLSSISSMASRLTLDCSTQQVRQFLLDHLAAQLVTPRQLRSDLVLNTLSGKRLLLSSVPAKKIVVVDGQPVVAATRAKNGMVYVINKFLNITQQVPNVMDLIESSPNLKTFNSYLSFASMNDRLKRETGPITILAPTNEAFEQLSSGARQLLNSDPAAMMDILRGHIVEGAQFGKLISMRNRLKTMNSDHFIEARVMKPNVYQLDNQMTSMRLVGTSGNGVVNAIDRLIVPAWLRVAPRASGGSSPPPPQQQVGTSRPPSALGEFDESSSSLRNAPALPALNGQPLRFEQPVEFARSSQAPALTSFSLANNAENNIITAKDSKLLQPPTSSLVDSFGEPATTTTTPAPRLAELPLLRNVIADNFVSINSSAAAAAPATSNSLLNDNHLNDDNARQATKNMLLIEKLANLMKARKFIKYLLKSRLGDQLKPDMNYVILVPTDQAIERLPSQIIDTLERDIDRLSDLVNFHVLDTTFEYINTIPDGQTLNTLNEKDILFNWHRNNTILTASGAVVLGGIQEENIALLIVDRVLYPTPGDLLSIVTKSPILSNFTRLIKHATLDKQLSLAGPFTLFAPSDFAFSQVDKRHLDFLLANRESARRFLLRHLSQPAIFTSSIALSNSSSVSSSIAPSAQPPTLSITNSLGEDLQLKQKNDYFSVNDVNFSYADVAATNGVVHVIDGIL